MFAVLATKSLQTSVLAALLFYVFANPDMYKMLRQFPGLKFVMKSATEISHQGTMVNAVLFGLVMLRRALRELSAPGRQERRRGEGGCQVGAFLQKTTLTTC